MSLTNNTSSALTHDFWRTFSILIVTTTTYLASEWPPNFVKWPVKSCYVCPDIWPCISNSLFLILVGSSYCVHGSLTVLCSCLKSLQHLISYKLCTSLELASYPGFPMSLVFEKHMGRPWGHIHVHVASSLNLLWTVWVKTWRQLLLTQDCQPACWGLLCGLPTCDLSMDATIIGWPWSPIFLTYHMTSW